MSHYTKLSPYTGKCERVFSVEDSAKWSGKKQLRILASRQPHYGRKLNPALLRIVDWDWQWPRISERKLSDTQYNDSQHCIILLWQLCGINHLYPVNSETTPKQVACGAEENLRSDEDSDDQAGMSIFWLLASYFVKSLWCYSMTGFYGDATAFRIG